MVTMKQRFDNDDHYDGGNTKEYIVIHDTGNVTDSDEGNANYFCTGSRQASAHYFVDDDSTTQVVKDDDCSWHCGDGGGRYGITNRNSIGVEQCRVNGVVTAQTMQNTLELVVSLMKKYGIPESKVVRHYDASRKNCPASFNLDGKWSRWFEFKDKLHTRLTGNAPAPTPSPSGEMYRIRRSWSDVTSQIGAYRSLDGAKALAKANTGYNVYNSSGQLVYPIPAPTSDYPSDLPLRVGSTGSSVKFVQRFLGIPADGIFGGQTKIAVINYQKMRGIGVDGVVGKVTWSNMKG